MIKIEKTSAIPLYKQVKAGLLDLFSSNTLLPDQPIPTERELAERLGLSRLTIRRSLQELAREGFVRRIAGRGTFLIHGGSRPSLSSIAFVLDRTVPANLSGIFTMRLLQGLRMAEADIRLTIRSQPKADEDMTGVQGIFALWVLEAEAMARLAAFGLPLVAYECAEHPGSPPCDAIGHANEQGAYQAVRALIGLGHCDIGCVIHPTSAGRERQKGFERAMGEQGFTVAPERLASVMPTGEAGYAYARRLLAAPVNAPTAVFCSDDMIAHGIMAAARDLGVRIPEALSIIGFGDLGFFTAPALSSVRMDVAASGRDAIRLLLERFANPALPARRHILPTEFIDRASCGPPRQR